MRILVVSLVLLSFAFSLSLKEEIEKCSSFEGSKKRLACYDKIAKDIKPSSEFITQGYILVEDCKTCHGKKWNVSTDGERLVKDMSEKEIETLLFAYKNKQIKSLAMNYQMSKYTKKQIKQISKYISYEIMTSK